MYFSISLCITFYLSLSVSLSLFLSLIYHSVSLLLSLDVFALSICIITVSIVVVIIVKLGRNCVIFMQILKVFSSWPFPASFFFIFVFSTGNKNWALQNVPMATIELGPFGVGSDHSAYLATTSGQYFKSLSTILVANSCQCINQFNQVGAYILPELRC